MQAASAAAKNANTQTGADVTLHILENGSTWLVNWPLVSNSLPPRNPNDDEEEKDEEEDEENEDQEEESPVVREPDE
jgi:hypothetical protein